MNQFPIWWKERHAMSDKNFITDPSSWKDITPDMYDEINAQIEETFSKGCHGQCATCESGCENKLPVFAKKMYTVVGKGGAGKSTVTVLLAYALARKGYRVGVLDCDLPGSTVPQLMGLTDRVHIQEEEKTTPLITPEGIVVNSMNLIVEDRAEPILWAGVDTFSVVDFLYRETIWGQLDVMLLDMPAGAADVPLNLYTSFPVDGSIVVTVPGSLAYVPTQRTIRLCSMLMNKPVAYIENWAFEEGSVSAKRYELPPACVKVGLPLNPELAAKSEAGDLADYAVPALDPVVDLIATAVDNA
jgi:Mrp family chromosome partitioning ATPase